MDINPIAILVRAYRDVLMRDMSPDFTGLFIILIASIIVMILALRHYSKHEHKIIKAL